MYESQIARGQRNAQAIPLIKAHCAHARVELSDAYGYAPLEDAVGLPINVREMRCEFAPAPISVTRDLLEGAIAFYEHNCIGCPHRQAQGVPNLKTVAKETMERRERERAAQEAAVAGAQRDRAARAGARAAQVAGEPAATRALIALLDDAVDAETPDRERGRELVDLCRLQPELCTPAAGEVLLEVSVTHPTEQLFEALGHLDAARRLDRDRLLAVALAALRTFPVVGAARLVVELQDDLAAGALRPALRSIVYVAAPAEMFPGRPPESHPLALAVAARHDLPAVLDELQHLIGSAEEYPRRVGAGAAALLIGIEPSVAGVLVGPLVDALSLPDSMSGFFGSPRDEILDALHAALVAAPDATAPVLEARGRSGDDDVRSALFNAYGMVMRQGRPGGEVGERAGTVTLDAAFRRLDGDWGKQIAFEAADLIASAAEHEPALMVPRVDQLFGALVAHGGGRTRDPTVPALSATSAGNPPWLAAMEQYDRRSAHAALVRELRRALGVLVPHAPQAVARNVMSVIEAPEFDSEDAKELRDEAVQLLGDLGQDAELLPDVLPSLWSALVHSDQRVRARAVGAWQKIAARGHRLPSELAELIPVLLRDQFVIVHSATIRAMRNGLPVPDEQLPTVVGLLLAWAQTYASKDAQLLDELLQLLWSLAGRLPDDASAALREQCLQLAEHLTVYDKERFVEWRPRGWERSPSLAARVLEVARDRRVQRVGQRDDRVLRRLRGLDGGNLSGLGNEIKAVAQGHLPHDPWEAQRFIEILQRAGHWTQAVQLAEAIRDTIPDDQEHAIQRRGAEALLELAHAEDLLRRGATHEASAALGRARAAVDEQQAQIERLPKPWETA